jgi:hypothetical protein
LYVTVEWAECCVVTISHVSVAATSAGTGVAVTAKSTYKLISKDERQRCAGSAFAGGMLLHTLRHQLVPPHYAAKKLADILSPVYLAGGNRAAYRNLALAFLGKAPEGYTMPPDTAENRKLYADAIAMYMLLGVSPVLLAEYLIMVSNDESHPEHLLLYVDATGKKESKGDETNKKTKATKDKKARLILITCITYLTCVDVRKTQLGVTRLTRSQMWECASLQFMEAYMDLFSALSGLYMVAGDTTLAFIL